MRADGSHRREIFSTQGLEGTSGSPPFCMPPQCVDLPRAALDQTIRDVDWSPDGRTVAATICVRSRYHWGESDDDTCHVEILDAASGAVIRSDLDGWFRPDWGAAGRMLFNGPAQYPDYTLRGVWEGDPSVTPATQALIVPAPTDLLVGGDRLPTWAPDGRHFVTARQIGGNRWDANGFAVTNEAVVLHDREDVENPRVLLIADHGGISGAIDDFTWSPDGRWVLYTLYESADAADIWWLDVETGATGRVTNDGASVSVDWRKRDDGGPGPDPVPGTACGAETPGAPRAACWLAAIASEADATPATTRGARRSLKRVVQRATAARKVVLQLAKRSTARRVAKARKATIAMAAAIERAKTTGDVPPVVGDALAAMATAATTEIDGL
jgi:hypothetical protein